MFQRPLRHALLGATLALAFATPALAVDAPHQFVVEDAAPGAGLNTPVAIAFLPSGRMLVAEKRGRVYAITNGIKNPTPMLSRENEVLNVDDRGMLGLAVDPNYVTNRFIYVLYVVDPDSNGTDNNDDAFVRLTRYQVSAVDSNIVDPASRTILLGATWRTGAVSASPSHAAGALRWGADGSLLVSIGDGAQFSQMDKGGLDVGAFGATKTDPFENIGAFRSQYVGSLCGKILRIDPATGLGYASNPYYDGNPASNRSRVWCYGLRNPYRYCVRPGTGASDPALGQPGTLYIGDVGWNNYEEADIARTGGKNFGWPCYEGFGLQPEYSIATPAHGGCDSIGTFNNPTAVTAPLISWHHTDSLQSIPAGFTGNTSTGGVWYTGTRYSAQYQNTYFFGDYGQNWIRYMVMDSLDHMLSLNKFAEDADGPVDFTVEPGTGDIYYVAILTGEVRRIRYVGNQGNQPPVVNAIATPNVGVVPLNVNFSSAGTVDPDDDPLALSWNFGDGQGSTLANPSHVYNSAGTFLAVLSATDTVGAVTRDTVQIIVASSAAFPTTAVLDNFNRANGAVGGSWTGSTTGMTINANALTQTCCYVTTAWNGAVFGPDQEVYITLNQVTASAPEHDILLKIQGTATTAGHIEIRWDATTSQIGVGSFDPASGWAGYLTIPGVTFQAGDRFGARAYANGALQVYKNSTVIGTTSVAAWRFSGSGGRVGLTISGATSSRMDDFGGGNTIINSNTAPHSTITSPVDSSFYKTGDLILLTGTGTDAQDASGALVHAWEMDLHHNNHIHPNSFVSDSASTSFIAQNHDDGTGIYLILRHIVIDTGGLRDTARVNIFPEIDLTPSVVTTLPTTPGTTAPATWRFAIRNLGRMPSPLSRWRLIGDTTLLAEGDTLVAPLDSVVISRSLAPVLAAGAHTIRVVVDTLRTVVETAEGNNAQTRSITVVPGSGPDQVPPLFVMGPTGTPIGDRAQVTWKNSEITTGVVRFGLTPSLGDSVPVPADSVHAVSLLGLTRGVRYYFRAVARDSIGNAAIAALDSFTTQSGVATVEPLPTRFALSNGYPNPSSGAIAFALDLPRPAHVEFSVHDLAGREVWRDSGRDLAAGRFRLGWDGSGRSGARMSPGLYLTRIQVDGRTYVRRIALLR